MNENTNKESEVKEKMYEYLVEVIYQQTYIKNLDTPEARKEIGVTSQVFSFTNPKKEVAKYNARKEMESYIRHGMKLSGGSVIESWIHPSALLQVGLIDMELHQKEQELASEEITGAVPANVEPENAE